MNKIQETSTYFIMDLIKFVSEGFIVNLFLAYILSYWIGRTYIKYGQSMSNRHTLADHFLLITMTTLLVITVVKSSLTLSLGLVGALSIVRFRTAIKEPEELAYLFLVIAVGLGLGANQRLTTILAVCVIVGILHIRATWKRTHPTASQQDVYLTITTECPDQLSLSGVTEILQKYCVSFHMKRMDKTASILEMVFLVELSSIDMMQNIETTVRMVDNHAKIIILSVK